MANYLIPVLKSIYSTTYSWRWKIILCRSRY